MAEPTARDAASAVAASEGRIAWWRGHRLGALLGDKTSGFRWECRRCGDVSACWRNPRRHCPGRTEEGR